MAGTDHAKRGLTGVRDDGPAIILVGPQLGENIGTAARAMLNCGLADLRLVAPRDGWPSEAAYTASSGAHAVLDQTRVFERVEDAVADLQEIYATTARTRDMVKDVVTPERAARDIHAAHRRGSRCGLLFGRERTGLTNDEVALAGTLLEVPLNPGFSSLNLAQAVLLIGYAWYAARDQGGAGANTDWDHGHRRIDAGHRRARAEEIQTFFDHLERALDGAGFFKTPQLRPTMVRNLRNLFHRAQLTDQDVRTLHGVVTALTGRRMDQLG